MLKSWISRASFFFFGILIVTGTSSCKQEKKQKVSTAINLESIKYAEGFAIADYGNFKIIEVTQPWPEAEKTYRYALLPEGNELPDSLNIDAKITVPVQSIVVTSTTHIPSLEMLGVENTLTGFPNLDYISSEKTRQRIANGHIKELGQNESINTETTVLLNPDVIVSFGVAGQNKSLDGIARSGIPVVYNGDWVEQNPLGKAEWIKFFAAFYNKQKQADSIFKVIENQYLETQKIAATAANSPTVLSGALFKDVWYAPKGDSWSARLIADANGDYLYSDIPGTGSRSLSLETVLNDALDAAYWIAPNAFTTLEEMRGSNSVYAKFKAFQDKKVYGFGTKKGATGGILYYEVAPNRPDWVLQDLVHILHPGLLPNHQPHFFFPLEDR
ncbi:MAG: ABC transporter substrate-binding protein [Leeuwenhoekiella sp.]